MGLRADLAAYLTANLPGVTVYEAGAELVQAPAVVINPSDPYLVPVTFGATPADTVVAAGLELYLVVGRAGPESNRLDELEALRRLITELLHDKFTPAGRWVGFGEFATVEVGGVDHASAKLEYVFRDNDGNV
jgi:hypothetical protein